MSFAFAAETPAHGSYRSTVAMRSARFIGDYVLDQVAAGNGQLFDGFDDLSVLRVQEALTFLGYAPGKLDGIFGPTTGAAVSAFKRDKGLTPADPVVGKGTAKALDAAVFVDPPYNDPAFGELASYVARQAVEPFVGFELNYLVTRNLRSLRRDVGFTLLSMLRDQTCLAIVAQSRADGIPDPRVDADTRATLANSVASAVTSPFTGPDGIPRVAVGIKDVTIMGRRFHTNKQGAQAKVTMRSALIHEVVHIRNADSSLQFVTDNDSTVYVDTGVAASISTTSGKPTANTFFHFAHEIVASHVEWVTQKEDAGDPNAARFLPAGALAEAAYWYFTGQDLKWFQDNGYMAACVRGGDIAIYRQAALWLRTASGLYFSNNSDLDDISTQLFHAAADEAERLANDPSASHLSPDGVSPLPGDYVFPP
jgi:peptidoglycan hydrolase-like protein with peptidoglycan-binding domain